MSNTIDIRVQPNTYSPFNRKWISTYAVTELMASVLTDKNQADLWAYLFIEPADFFISLRVYPFDVLKYFNLTRDIAPMSRIKMGTVELKWQNRFWQAPIMPSISNYKHIGTIKIEPIFNNFLDYSPYTLLELYIPYCGFVTLDTNVVMGKEIRLFISVDFDTGKCTGYVIVHSLINGVEDDELILTTEGQIGFLMPMGATNAIENQRNQMATAATFLGGVALSVATANPLPLIAGSVAGGLGLFKSSIERVSKGGSASGMNSLVNPNFAYLVRTTPKIVGKGIEEYRKIKGVPLREKKFLRDLTGFTKIGDVLLNNFPTATKSEKEKIESVLKEGIIL